MMAVDKMMFRSFIFYEKHKDVIKPLFYFAVALMCVAMCKEVVNRTFKLALTYWEMLGIIWVLKLTHESWSYFGPVFFKKEKESKE